MTTSRLLRVFALLLLALVTACGSMGAKRNPRDDMLYLYVSAIRWSDFDKAVAFIDPKVSGYDVRTGREPAEGEYEQVVEIRFVNRHTQVEKIVTDHQHWRYDPEAKRWWLTTGLPRLDAH
jgi:hypothetical protein